jgi:hypothetical protein
MAMSLAFSASQKLVLPVSAHRDRLPNYLREEGRVVHAMLDPVQLQSLGPGHYRYTVTRVQVFQLQIQPIVELQSSFQEDRLLIQALDCELEGLGLVDDFQLTLASWLRVGAEGLEGEASLGVQVSRPPLLKLIPGRVLEATGTSVLGGILHTIRSRVSQQLLSDFANWCAASPES